MIREQDMMRYMANKRILSRKLGQGIGGKKKKKKTCDCSLALDVGTLIKLSVFWYINWKSFLPFEMKSLGLIYLAKAQVVRGRLPFLDHPATATTTTATLIMIHDTLHEGRIGVTLIGNVVVVDAVGVHEVVCRVFLWDGKIYPSGSYPLRFHQIHGMASSKPNETGVWDCLVPPTTSQVCLFFGVSEVGAGRLVIACIFEPRFNGDDGSWFR